jgi:hypothetical protein
MARHREGAKLIERLPMRRAAALIVAAAVLALTSACNPAASPSSAPPSAPLLTTGVRGLVLAGPTCPVEQAGQSPCVRPVPGAIIVALDSAGHEVGRSATDATGHYFLHLPPGSYQLVPQAVVGLLSKPAPASVTVTDGSPTQLDLQYDTGIR